MRMAVSKVVTSAARPRPSRVLNDARIGSSVTARMPAQASDARNGLVTR